MGTNSCSPGEARRLARHIANLDNAGKWQTAVGYVPNDPAGFDAYIKVLVHSKNDRDILWNGIIASQGNAPGPGFTW